MYMHSSADLSFTFAASSLYSTILVFTTAKDRKNDIARRDASLAFC
jgi:hypothetical protein